MVKLDLALGSEETIPEALAATQWRS